MGKILTTKQAEPESSRSLYTYIRLEDLSCYTVFGRLYVNFPIPSSHKHMHKTTPLNFKRNGEVASYFQGTKETVAQMSDGLTTHIFHHLQLLLCYFQAPFLFHLGSVTMGVIRRSIDASCCVTPQETAKQHNSLFHLPHHAR